MCRPHKIPIIIFLGVEIESWAVPFPGPELSRLIAESLTLVPLLGYLYAKRLQKYNFPTRKVKYAELVQSIKVQCNGSMVLFQMAQLWIGFVSLNIDYFWTV